MVWEKTDFAIDLIFIDLVESISGINKTQFSLFLSFGSFVFPTQEVRKVDFSSYDTKNEKSAEWISRSDYDRIFDIFMHPEQT